MPSTQSRNPKTIAAEILSHDPYACEAACYCQRRQTPLLVEQYGANPCPGVSFLCAYRTRTDSQGGVMAARYDLVIRGGTVADGKGGPLLEADVAIAEGTITDIGKVSGSGLEEIDARGQLVAPGFVDIHTHYDGQATWDERLAPSCWHGVTTAVMGNCGVGFAPVRATDHARLIELMEGVEDIPGTALHEGLSWDWESFAGYLDALDRREHDIDICAQLPHAALRVFVMGERAARLEPATPRDIQQMRELAFQ